ncbi:hypothetical protein DL93DRAFT_774118 [Clavulina sp. PMI_390]|nr:hypothetical protein DL93DRAFT_774118 [Clavulina sp. PMI_390]
MAKTCKLLYHCASDNFVWRRAWTLARVPLPPLEPPALVLPDVDWLSLNPRPDADAQYTTEISPIEGFHRMERLNALPSIGYHARYIEAIRVQHQLRQPQVVMERLTVALPYLSFSEGRNTAFASGGDVFVSWLDKKLHIFDLRMGLKYTATLRHSSYHTRSGAECSLILAHLMTYEEALGVLIVICFPLPEGVSLFFQPFLSSGSAASPLKHLATINSPQDMEARFSGDYLIIGTYLMGIGNEAAIRILDLRQGRAFSIREQTLTASQVRVYRDEYVALRLRRMPQFYLTRLTHLSPNPAESAALATGVHIEGLTDAHTPPAALYDPSLGRNILPVWCMDPSAHSWEWRVGGISIVKLEESYISWNPSEIHSEPPRFTKRADLSAPFTHALLPSSSLPHSRFALARRLMRQKHPTAAPPTSRPVFSTHNVAGHQRVLSNVLCDSPSVKQETLVLTELSGSGKEIVHKPLFVRHRAWDGREALGQYSHRRRPPMTLDFCWDELSGRIALRTVAKNGLYYTVTLYQI